MERWLEPTWQVEAKLEDAENEAQLKNWNGENNPLATDLCWKSYSDSTSQQKHYENLSGDAGP